MTTRTPTRARKPEPVEITVEVIRTPLTLQREAARREAMEAILAKILEPKGED